MTKIEKLDFYTGNRSVDTVFDALIDEVNKLAKRADANASIREKLGFKVDDLEIKINLMGEFVVENTEHVTKAEVEQEKRVMDAALDQITTGLGSSQPKTGHWHCETCGPVEDRQVKHTQIHPGVWEHDHFYHPEPIEESTTIKTVHPVKYVAGEEAKPEEPNNRLYWQMTEVFVKLHGSDVCGWKSDNENHCAHCKFINDTFAELFVDTTI